MLQIKKQSVDQDSVCRLMKIIITNYNIFYNNKQLAAASLLHKTEQEVTDTRYLSNTQRSKVRGH